MIKFVVPGLPVSEPRKRVAVRGGFAKVYTPTDSPVNAYKAAVRLIASKQFRDGPLTGPLKVDIQFVLPRPKSKRWKNKEMEREPHYTRPDKDNLEKAVLDALHGIAFHDDAQVADGRTRKWIAAGDELPGTHVVISEL